MRTTVIFTIKLFIAAGKASASPPVGPILGQYRLNLMEFCKDFNTQTALWEENLFLPVVIIGYSDGDFEYSVKLPTSYFLLKSVTQKEKGSSHTGHEWIGVLTIQQLYEVSFIKEWCINFFFHWHKKCSILTGVIKSMGIVVI